MASAAAALRAHVGVLGLGVITAAVATCSGLTLQLLSQRCHGSAPALLAFSAYVLLALIWAPLAVWAYGWRSLWCSARWFVFPLLALLDVQANMLVVWAYRYASIKAVALTSSSSVPFVMLLSAFLGRPPRLAQLIGATICLAGVIAYTSRTASSSPSSSGSDQLLGCLLALGSALAYALVNVAGERLMQRNGTGDGVPITVYIAAFSLHAFLIALLQAAALLPLEAPSLLNASAECGAHIVAILFLSFSIVLFVFYSLVTVVLRYSSAAWFNCALLSGNLFALAGARIIFGTPLDAFYFVCLVLVILGLLVFYLPSPSCTSVLVLSYWERIVSIRSQSHTPM